MNAIDIQSISKYYGEKHAVDGVSLSVAQGELVSLLGVNGAGKSTLIHLLTGLITPTAGDALIHGKSIVKDPHQVKSLLGVSPQETAIAPNLTVRENLELMAGVHGFDRKKTKSKTDELITNFNLSTVEKQKSKTLSGGWKRRLSIAMALISEPKVLFLDEPTLGLDILARRELWQVIEKIRGTATIVLTTHYLEEADALSDRIFILKNGRLEAAGTSDELKQQTGTTKFEDAFIKLVMDGEKA